MWPTRLGEGEGAGEGLGEGLGEGTGEVADEGAGEGTGEGEGEGVEPAELRLRGARTRSTPRVTSDRRKRLAVRARTGTMSVRRLELWLGPYGDAVGVRCAWRL